MSYQSIAPVLFGTKSLVTATLGRNDPELGTIHTDTDGLTYQFVYNAGGEQIPPGYGCVPNSAATGYSVTVSSTTSADLCVGVVRHATITTDTYGWVVVRGITPIKMGATSGSVAARGLVEIADNGLFVPVSNTTGNKAPAVGVAIAAIVSSASGNAFIKCF